MRRIYPVIMAGGAGKRLWPLSRPTRPKQYLSLFGGPTLLQETALRLAPGDDVPFATLTVVCDAANAELVDRQLAETGSPPADKIVEPVGRNTAACAAAAALVRPDPDDLILLAPADHHIADPASFRRTVAAAAAGATDGRLVTFGITPTHPETGYGYIRLGGPEAGLFEVEQFVEKPDHATAEGYLATGRYVWNSGIFLFRARDLLEELRAFRPDVLAAVQSAASGGEQRGGELRLQAEAFAAGASVSIDVAVMEKTRRGLVAPLSVGWSDVGSWSAVWRASAQDAAGNVALGRVELRDCEGCLVRTDGPMVAVSGLTDVVVVVSDGVVMVLPRSRDADAGAFAEKLAPPS
jgi:mannose-1-phosphate guanylyltransferase/mannose-6-phosphate isomerase